MIRERSRVTLDVLNTIKNIKEIKKDRTKTERKKEESEKRKVNVPSLPTAVSYRKRRLACAASGCPTNGDRETQMSDNEHDATVREATNIKKTKRKKNSNHYAYREVGVAFTVGLTNACGAGLVRIFNGLSLPLPSPIAIRPSSTTAGLPGPDRRVAAAAGAALRFEP